MNFNIKHFRRIKTGNLYKCEYLNDQINLQFKKVIPIFGIEYVSNYKYIKWKLDDILIDISKIEILRNFETFLKDEFPEKEIKSVIIEKNNYPLMINTKYIESKTGNIIISEKGEVPTINEFINKNKLYNIDITLENIFVNDKFVNYSLIIKKISVN